MKLSLMLPKGSALVGLVERPQHEKSLQKWLNLLFAVYPKGLNGTEDHPHIHTFDKLRLQSFSAPRAAEIRTGSKGEEIHFERTSHLPKYFSGKLFRLIENQPTMECSLLVVWLDEPGKVDYSQAEEMGSFMRSIRTALIP